MGENRSKHHGGDRLRWAMLLALLVSSSQATSAQAQEPSNDMTSAAPSPENGGTSNNFPLTREAEKNVPAVGKRVPVPRPSGHRFWPGLSSTIATEASGASTAPATSRASGWWLGSAGIALALAICGALCIAARKHSLSEAAELLQVIGRVSLSPRQSIVLVRAGERVLLIGTGAQGAPSLLGELPADEDDHPPGADRADASADQCHRPALGSDVRLGETP